jgi:3-phenylpropionate/trans-cinnamate dioxygenase ferredoxin reductase subunit
VVSEPQNVSSALRSGLPTDYLPSLTADDVVYTCGAPGMTEAVARIARAAGAPCYTDPFVANLGASEDAGLMGRVAGWFDSSRRNAEVARVA